METTVVSTLILGLMFLLLALGLPIGFAMGAAGLTGTMLLIDLEAALWLPSPMG